MTQTLPDLREIGFDYDRNGNVTAITPPSRPEHEFGYTKADLPEEYTPPEIDAGPRKTIFQYNEDQQVTQIDRPDSQSILYDYDPASGRLERVTTPRGDYVYHYDEATSNVTRVEDPDGGSLEYTYDGSLPLTVTWSGEVEGSIEQVYSDDLRVEERTVNGEDPVTFEYDVDGFLVRAGELELRHRPADGFLAGTTLGDVTDEYDYNAYSEVKSYEAQYRGSDFYQLSFTRDALGRITRRRDWIQGVGINLDYRYDDAGRLDKVLRAGVVLADYDSDPNGNRIAWRDQISSGTATYDAQDRLLTYGPATYMYNANGDLESKSVGDQTITYDYDVSGNLRRVVLANGIEIDYVIDAANRRVGKKINGELVKAYLYADQLNPIAELDPVTGEILTRFIYASSGHVPDTMVRDEISYRLISDHLGSVRLVVNVATGEIVQRIDYDAFGRILQDTKPGFQPFGFAGGLYDHQTGLVRFGARDYDPETGRWTSKDSTLFSSGASNFYRYVADPVNSFDPLGESAWTAAKGFARGAVVGAAVGVVAVGAVMIAPAAAPLLALGAAISAATAYYEGIAIHADICATADDKHEFWGEVAGGATGGGLAGSAVGLRAAGIRGAGREFSHAIPDRVLRNGGRLLRESFGKSAFNGNVVSPRYHALSDPFRYRFMPRTWKAVNPKLPGALQLAMRVPFVYPEAGGGAAYGVTGAYLDD